MKDKIYPAIYKSEGGDLYTYKDANNFYRHEGGVWSTASCIYDEDGHSRDKNITREYLANTYGKLQSPNHGIFIRLLCKNHGISVNEFPSQLDSYFAVYGDELLFFHNEESASKLEGKQITIPTPPKCDEPLNNGDNLMFGGEDKFKEWPKIGDYVALRYRFDSKQIIHKGELLYLSDNHIIIKLESGNDYHCIRGEWDIEKPKTPEEEFIYDVAHLFRTKHDYLCFADELLSKYNITKKPQ